MRDIHTGNIEQETKTVLWGVVFRGALTYALHTQGITSEVHKSIVSAFALSRLRKIHHPE